MSRIDALREALLWAAGNEVAHFGLRSGEIEGFLAAVKMHRLTGRLVRRLRREPAGPGGELLDEAERTHDAIARATLDKVDAAARLGRAMRESGSDDPVVLLKGFTLYALTGDPLDLRFMNDLDLNASDLDRFVDVAAGLGFVSVRPYKHLAEYAVMLSPADGYLEVHSYFDITSLDGDATPDDLAPARHAGVWEQRKHFRVSYLRHDDFRDQLAATSFVPEEIRPLRPETAALIIAAHLFKSFLIRPYPLPIATIPLDEVATFVDLCRLPSFEAARFAALVDRFEGHTAVGFVSALAKDLLGMSVPGANGRDRHFPTNLWWDGLDGGGFPVDVGWDPGQLVYRDRPLSQFVDTLGTSEITGLGNGKAYSFRLLGSANGGAGNGSTSNGGPARYIFRRDPDSTFAVDCALARESGGLLLTFTMPAIPDDRMVAIAAGFQDHRYEMFLNTAVREPFWDYSTNKEAAQEVAMTRQSLPEAEVVQLRLPAQIVEHCQVDGVIHGFIVVREQVREWERMTAGAAVPLRIQTH